MNKVKALDFLKASEEFFFFAQMMRTVVEVGNENETLRQIINFLEEDGTEIPKLPPPKKDSVLN